MGEEDKSEKRLVFGGLVGRPEIEMVPVTLQETLEWSYDSELIGRVVDLNQEDSCMTFDIECVNPKIFRLILGLPEKPLSKLKKRKKSFKKALMAYGYTRDRADDVCRNVALCAPDRSYSWFCNLIIFEVKEVRLWQ